MSGCSKASLSLLGIVSAKAPPGLSPCQQGGGDLHVVILYPLALLQGKASGEPLGNEQLKRVFGS